MLVTGFPPGLATLGSLERIELRGRLAGRVLSAIDTRETCDGQLQREQEILEASREPIVLLGWQGTLSESDRVARKLLLSLPPALGEGGGAADSPLPANKQFPEIFRVRDRERVALWQKRQRSGHNDGGEPPEVELDSGARVKLRAQATDGRTPLVQRSGPPIFQSGCPASCTFHLGCRESCHLRKPQIQQATLTLRSAPQERWTATARGPNASRNDRGARGPIAGDRAAIEPGMGSRAGTILGGKVSLANALFRGGHSC